MVTTLDNPQKGGTMNFLVESLFWFAIGGAIVLPVCLGLAQIGGQYGWGLAVFFGAVFLLLMWILIVLNNWRAEWRQRSRSSATQK